MAAAAANNKKSRWLFGREKKRVGTTCRVLFGEWRIRRARTRSRYEHGQDRKPKADPKAVGKSCPIKASPPPRRDGNDGMPSNVPKYPLPQNLFHNLAISRRLFLGEREGDEKPDPSVRSFPPQQRGSRDLTLLTSVLTAFDLTTLQTRDVRRKDAPTKVSPVSPLGKETR